MLLVLNSSSYEADAVNCHIDINCNYSGGQFRETMLSSKYTTFKIVRSLHLSHYMTCLLTGSLIVVCTLHDRSVTGDCTLQDPSPGKNPHDKWHVTVEENWQFPSTSSFSTSLVVQVVRNIKKPLVTPPKFNQTFFLFFGLNRLPNSCCRHHC